MGAEANQTIVFTSSWVDDLQHLCSKYDVDITTVVFISTDDELRVEGQDNSMTLIKDRPEVTSYLINYGITCVPCIVHVRDGNCQILDFDKLDSEQDTDDHFACAIDAYNSFDLNLATKSFYKLLKKDPNHLQGLFNFASVLHMIGYPILAVSYIQRLLVLQPDDVTAHSFLWALTSSPECLKAGTAVYRHLATLGDLRAVTKLAALMGEGSSASRGDPSYARQIYDDMAERFESKLVDHLGYRGPWLLLDLLEGLYSQSLLPDATIAMPAAKGTWKVLDVGCGSGLVGRVFEQYCTGGRSSNGANSDNNPRAINSISSALTVEGAVMVGVDVSERMVQISREKGGYDFLQCCDLAQALLLVNEGNGETETRDGTVKDNSNAQQQRLDMIVAADTFIYVGALGEVFQQASRALKTNGLLLFSCEDLESSPMRVAVQGTQEAKQGVVSGIAQEHPVSEDCIGNTNADMAPPLDAGAEEERQHNIARDGTSVSKAVPDTVDDREDDTTDSSEIVGAVPGWGCQLLSSARFAHSNTYILQLAARHRFSVLVQSQVVLRTEETIPLLGNFFILQKMETSL